MADRQNEIFGEGISQPERDFVVVIAAVHGVTRHILQRIVHEAHVPFEAEAQMLTRGFVKCRLADARPRR